jgi:hypothetical protein
MERIRMAEKTHVFECKPRGRGRFRPMWLVDAENYLQEPKSETEVKNR